MAAPTTKAPDYKLYRTLSAVDTIPATDKNQGLNCQNYETVHFEVVPTVACNPAFELMFWSEAAGKFVSAHTPVTLSQKGAGVAYTYSYDVKGRIVLLAATTLAAGSVSIYTNAFGTNSDLA